MKIASTRRLVMEANESSSSEWGNSTDSLSKGKKISGGGGGSGNGGSIAERRAAKSRGRCEDQRGGGGGDVGECFGFTVPHNTSQNQPHHSARFACYTP
ncbi:hypothetical protein NL676_004387 [Syzygium grande]|nr:hypothetical protein NL676_004387 [Syzygium grande]